MDMGVEGYQSAEGLYEQNQPRPALHPGADIGLNQQSLHDMAQLAEQSTPAREDRPRHPGYGEDVLPVRYRRKDIRLDPIPIGEHALLVTTRAEITSLTREREQVIVTAFGTIDAGESVVRIPAFQESIDDALFEQPLQALLGSKFRPVAIDASEERARARSARAIHTACWRPSGRSRT